MSFSRREFLAAIAAATSSGVVLAVPKTAEPGGGGLGIGSSSYSIRSRHEQGSGDPLSFARFCRERGAAGVQTSIGARDGEYIKRLRSYIDQTEMFLEGSVRLPRDDGDVHRFAAEVRTARSAGATVLRTVMLSGRRYETFRTAEEFREFRQRSWQSLQLAEPVLKEFGGRLAVENHKDYRTDELSELMRRLSSEYIGVCVDTGNNIALLDDPLETARALAPWAMSCHLKDMAVEESADGFLLSEVPLGEGRLDLRQIVRVLRETRSELRFSLEMITRDSLRIPCLSKGYWATMESVPARELARMLAWVRHNAVREPMPRISHLPIAEQLAIEDANVRKCIAYARDELKL